MHTSPSRGRALRSGPAAPSIRFPTSRSRAISSMSGLSPRAGPASHASTTPTSGRATRRTTTCRARATAPDPQICEAVSGAVARALHVVVRRVARPDVGVVDACEAGPARGESPLILEIARDREVGNLIDGAAGPLRSARPLLGDVCIRVADAEAERQLGQGSPVEFELEARAARATRVARVTVPAQREVNRLLDLVPID